MEENKKQKENEKEKEKVKKAEKAEYEAYLKQFTPKSKFVKNGILAFLVGGLLCTGAFILQTQLEKMGMDTKTAGNVITLLLIFTAQLLTGIGVFDRIAKFAGAGVIVPITGFANSMVATAMEFKSEGPVLGVGAKMFQLAGPVLVCGILTSVVVGLLYYVIPLWL